GRNNGDGTVTLFAVTSTVSASGDQGADPNRLVTITDTLSFQTAADASAEAFTVLKTAGFGEVLRGVEFIPLGADQYVSQLVRAALDTLLALPGSEFKGRHERRELARLLREILDAIEDHRDENAESRLRRALGDLKGIKDDAAEDAIEADLKAALGAIPEGRGDRDE
ncbi:MAG TPA: hypothetical protein VEN81_05175, partial [Planctomycetota bacterium]|nr:hypothetical protein [Planctomycetota bacterium]